MYFRIILYIIISHVLTSHADWAGLGWGRTPSVKLVGVGSLGPTDT